MKRLALVGMTLSLGLFSQGAVAGELIDHSAGLKLLAGADVWSTPANVPAADQNVLGFSGNAAGIGYGAMPYYELRILKLLGAEAGINYEHASFHRNLTLNGADYRETITLNSWRLPLLAKLNIPLGLGRLWFGLGPELTIAQSSTNKAELVSSGAPVGNTTTHDVKPTYFTGGLGLVIELPLIGVEIPVEFRASKNLSQPDNYADRVTKVGEGDIVRAESSWVYRLGAGLGFQF